MFELMQAERKREIRASNNATQVGFKSGLNWREARKTEVDFGYQNGKAYRYQKTETLEERDVGNIKELLAEQAEISAEIERLQKRQMEISAQLESVKTFYVEKWGQTPAEAEEFMRKSAEGNVNIDRLKRKVGVDAGCRKNIAHSDLCGDFEILPNNGGGINACLALAAVGTGARNPEVVNAIKEVMSGDYRMMETGTGRSLKVLKSVLGENTYLKFFRGNIRNMESAGGYPLGYDSDIDKVVYIHNIDNVHFQALLPINEIRALDGIPDNIKNGLKATIMSKRDAAGIYTIPEEDDDHRFEW